MIHLPYRWAPEAGRVTIPPGVVRPEGGLESGRDLHTDPQDGSVRFAGGELVYTFRLPETTGIVHLDRVEVGYEMTGTGQGEVLIYDWRQADWTLLEKTPSAGTGGVFHFTGSKVLPASRHARRGMVQIKVKHKATGAGPGLTLRALNVGFSGRAG